jgi:head-tail adaptor
MTFLADRLNKRVDVLEVVQTPRADGGFDRDYVTVLSVWAGLKPVQAGQYIRGVQVAQGITHIFTVRKRPFDELDPADSGFDSINLKRTYYIRFVPEAGVSSKGRLFRIISTINNEEQNEYYLINAEEILEEGEFDD